MIGRRLLNSPVGNSIEPQSAIKGTFSPIMAPSDTDEFLTRPTMSSSPAMNSKQEKQEDIRKGRPPSSPYSDWLDSASAKISLIDWS